MTKKASQPVESAGTKYSRLVDNAIQLVKKFSGQSLQFYWALGKSAAPLVHVSTEYGSKTLKNFCEDLKTATQIELQENSVYKAVKFSRTITPEQLEQLKQHNISWRVASRVVSSKLTPAEKQALLTDVCEGRVAPSTVNDEITTRQGAGKGPSEGKKKVKPLNLLKGAPELLHMVREKLTGYTDACNEVFKGGDVEAMKKAREHVKAMEEELDVFVSVMQDHVKVGLDGIKSVAEALTPPKGKGNGKKKK